MAHFLKTTWVKRTLLVFCALVFLALITPHWWYVGDGRLVDRGFFSYIPRYMLKLGLVDLTRRNIYIYEMGYLPRTELTIGLRITGHKQTSFEHIGETHPVNAKIHVLLRNREGLLVIDENASMKDSWVWMYALHDTDETFVYRRGKEEEVPIAEHTVHLNRIGVKADGGWGTYFSPMYLEKYRLVLEVLEGDPGAKEFQIELGAQGGGWEGF